MFKIAQKYKKRAAGLLLFSFFNILTFLPAAASNLVSTESQSVIEEYEEDIAGATVLELLLENIAGLTDYLPENEKQDFGYDYFSFKSRTADWISPLPINISIFPVVLLTIENQFFEQFVLSLPRLQHHHFIFRLTPF